MSWPCRLVAADTSPKEVGDVWFTWSLDGVDLCDVLSVEYTRDWAGVRPPVVIRLPGPVDVCLDRQVDGEGGHGWTVRGVAPHLTVTPSVNIIGVYHGFIRDGFVTPDCQGRLYRPDGTPLPGRAHAPAR